MDALKTEVFLNQLFDKCLGDTPLKVSLFFKINYVQISFSVIVTSNILQ